MSQIPFVFGWNDVHDECLNNSQQAEMKYYVNFKKHSTYDFALNDKKRCYSNVTLVL